MTVKATSNLSLDERSASFSIISDEVLGTKAVKEIFVTQESLAEGGPLEGLDAPVKWFFNGASGTDYTVPKEQFEQNNKLMASSGVGYISYFHTFNSDGSLHPNSTRMIGMLILAVVAFALPFVEGIPCLIALLFPRATIFVLQVTGQIKDV